jgi:5-methylcytosine-specific restriction protein A
VPNQRRRAQLFAAEPWCRTCRAQGIRTRATIADHIVPLAEGGADTLDNLAPVCHACHQVKTHTEAMRGQR